MSKSALSLAIIALALPFLVAPPVQATSLRTWVSGLGTDSGACRRAAPCATFQFAHDQTTAGGEINCVDAGNYSTATGPTTISKSIAITCAAGTAGFALNAGSSGFIIDAAPTDIVTLSGLTIDGRGLGGNAGGITLRHAAEVHIEKCTVRNIRQTNGSGILISLQASETMYVFVVDTVISDNSIGINALSVGGYKVVTLKNVVITGSKNDGVFLNATNVYFNITESIISANGSSAVNVAASSSTANIDRTTMANNTIALNAAAGATIRSIGNNIFNNTTAFALNGGSILSDGQNKTGGNANGQDPNGSVTLK